MIIRFAFLITLLQTAIAAQEYCNICGQGNSIQSPTGVVEFSYMGGSIQNNCQQLQSTVKNPNAISDDFCRNELLQYTHVVCRCTTPDGTLVKDIYQSPTVSPAPATATADEPTQSSGYESSYWTSQQQLILLFGLVVGSLAFLSY